MSFKFNTMYQSLGKWGKSLNNAVLLLERIPSKRIDRVFDVTYRLHTDKLAVVTRLSFNDISKRGTYSVYVKNLLTGDEQSGAAHDDNISHLLHKGGLEKLIDSLVRRAFKVERINLKVLNVSQATHDLTGVTCILDVACMEDRFYTLLVVSPDGDTPKLKFTYAVDSGALKGEVDCTFAGTDIIKDLKVQTKLPLKVEHASSDRNALEVVLMELLAK